MMMQAREPRKREAGQPAVGKADETGHRALRSRLPVLTGDQNREYGSTQGVGLGVQGSQIAQMRLRR